MLAIFEEMDWNRVVPETIGHALGVLIGFAISWYVLFRRKLQEIQRFQKGESDEVLFQTHQLAPIPNSDEVVMIFRNAGPRTTVNQLYDNVGAREMVRRLVKKTTVDDPILQTGGGRTGFEITNIALGYIAGELATSPFGRESWLFVMTCEDREIVRKQCVRCFLIRPQDLEKFKDWEWCRTKVRVEKPWHSFRIVALHRIAKFWEEEQEYFEKRRVERTKNMELPVIDEEVRHERIRVVSLGIYPDEPVVGEPVKVDWEAFSDRLEAIGLESKAAEEEEE